jgi:hypothetical protein
LCVNRSEGILMAIEKQVGPVTVQLVDNYRDWKKWLSMRFMAVTAILIAMPEIVQQLPPDMQASLPEWGKTFVHYCALASLILAAGSRVLKQKVPESTGPSVAPPAPGDKPAPPTI